MEYNYKKKYSNYDLVVGQDIVGSISFFYTYVDGVNPKRKVEFNPYPSLFNKDGLTFFRDNHWKLSDEATVENTDDTSEMEKINELLFTVVMKGMSNSSILQLERKRTAFDFEIPTKDKMVEFWLVYEFKDDYSFHVPTKRVYEKAGYYVIGFEISKDDSEIIEYLAYNFNS